MELFIIIVLLIGSWALPRIINYNKAKKEAEEKVNEYLRVIELDAKLKSDVKMTDEEFEEWASRAYLLAELKRKDDIKDDLSRR